MFLAFRDFRDPKAYMVRCGEWDTKSDSEPLSHQDRRVERITVHPSYKRFKYYDNNIAILHVEQDFNLEAHISPICLPDERTGQRSYLKEGCWATGWGKEDFSEKLSHAVLDIALIAIP